MTYTVHAAKTNLSKLIEQAEAGEEIIIARGDVPAVRLVPVVQKPRGWRFGALAGKCRVTAAFFDPLPDDDLTLWNGEGE